VESAPPVKVSDRTYFVLRRLHSLTGVVPVGVFLVEHLFTNARSLQGPAAFDEAAAELARIPFVLLLELFGIWLPILFHLVLGIFIAATARANLARHGDLRNWHYALQRVTGVFLVFFILFHTWSTRFDPGYLESASAYSHMYDQLANPVVLAFYALGVLAACYHLGNGLFGFAVHWGLVTGHRAQRLAGRLGLAIGAVLAAIGLAALLGFRGLRLDFLQKPHAQDHPTVVLGGGPR
jgi:succinate dehydrogenase / fumarate reductase cytochrome b subunit